MPKIRWFSEDEHNRRDAAMPNVSRRALFTDPRSPPRVRPWRPRYPIDVEAIAGTMCPKCGQPKGESCVYLKHPMWDPNSTYPSVRAKLDLVGTPTWACHNERRNIIRWRQARRWARERKLQEPAILRASSETRAAWRAGRDFDQREYEQLRDWYVCYGDILWKGSP